MDLSPLDVVRRAYEGWNAQDLDALLAIYHPDAVYDLSERVFNPDVYRGREELLRLGEEIRDTWKVALQHSTGVGHSSGVEVDESQSATLWTVRDGQVVHAKLFWDRRDAFAEAGIPDPE